MDEDKSSNQEDQILNSDKPQNQRLSENQTPSLPAEQPVHNKSHNFMLATVVVFLFLIAAGAVVFLMLRKEDPTPVENSQITQPDTEEVQEPAEETQTDATYQSELYPDLSFTVPEGWEVTEPETYSDNAFGDGSANSVIKMTNGDINVNLDFVTVMATGFEGSTCYAYEGLTAVGDVYRFVGSDGTIVYEGGVTEADEDWEVVIAQEGEYTFFEDPDPNYCVSFPYIGTYSSTLNQTDYPDQPYGFTDEQKVIVWLAAYIEGTPSEEQQTQADEIIKSLSQTDVGF